MNESAAEYERRAQWMRDWSGPGADWATRGAMDVAFKLEALGQLDELRSGYVPAGLSDVARGYRIGVTDDVTRSSGDPPGKYMGAVIAACATSR